MIWWTAQTRSYDGELKGRVFHVWHIVLLELLPEDGEAYGDGITVEGQRTVDSQWRIPGQCVLLLIGHCKMAFRAVCCRSGFQIAGIQWIDWGCNKGGDLWRHREAL